MGVLKRIYHVDKETGELVEFHSHPELHGSHVPAGTSAYARRPVRSIAMRVMPNDRPEFQRMVKESGVAGVEMLPDGRPEFRSKRSRDKFFRYLGRSTGTGWHDKDSFD